VETTVAPADGSRHARLAGLAGAVLLAVLPLPAAAQGEDEPAPPRPADNLAALHGRVSVAGTGEPLTNAVVHVPGRDRHAVVDSSGEYRIRGLEPGEVAARVEYLGAETTERTVELEPGEAARLDFRAREAAVELTELQVEVQRRRGKMAGFERRRKQGRGDFVTREDIERVNPVRTTRIIRHEAVGARIVRTESGDQRLLLRGTTGRCAPAVFLDGAFVPGFSVNDVHPGDLEAVEIYGGTRAPAEYRVRQGCGTVLLWTRTGG
jgi:hypothetical protein